MSRVLVEPVERDRIATAAKHLRDLLERIPASECYPGYEGFPHGWCGHASELLCTYLNDLRLSSVESFYVMGEHHTPHYQSHAWVEAGDLIIDITADQFAAELPQVWLTTDRGWHEQFDVKERWRADVIKKPDIFGWLPRLYKQMTDASAVGEEQPLV